MNLEQFTENIYLNLARYTDISKLRQINKKIWSIFESDLIKKALNQKRKAKSSKYNISLKYECLYLFVRSVEKKQYYRLISRFNSIIQLDKTRLLIYCIGFLDDITLKELMKNIKLKILFPAEFDYFYRKDLLKIADEFDRLCVQYPHLVHEERNIQFRTINTYVEISSIQKYSFSALQKDVSEALDKIFDGIIYRFYINFDLPIKILKMSKINRLEIHRTNAELEPTILSILLRTVGIDKMRVILSHVIAQNDIIKRIASTIYHDNIIKNNGSYFKVYNSYFKANITKDKFKLRFSFKRKKAIKPNSKMFIEKDLINLVLLNKYKLRNFVEFSRNNTQTEDSELIQKIHNSVLVSSIDFLELVVKMNYPIHSDKEMIIFNEIANYVPIYFQDKIYPGHYNTSFPLDQLKSNIKSSDYLYRILKKSLKSDRSAFINDNLDFEPFLNELSKNIKLKNKSQLTNSLPHPSTLFFKTNESIYRNRRPDLLITFIENCRQKYLNTYTLYETIEHILNGFDLQQLDILSNYSIIIPELIIQYINLNQFTENFKKLLAIILSDTVYLNLIEYIFNVKSLNKVIEICNFIYLQETTIEISTLVDKKIKDQEKCLKIKEILRL